MLGPKASASCTMMRDCVVKVCALPLGIGIFKEIFTNMGSLKRRSRSLEDLFMAGGTAEARFEMTPQASLLEAVVVTGYGTQRREAITGSVSSVDASAANVGAKTNVSQLLQGRAARRVHDDAGRLGLRFDESRLLAVLGVALELRIDRFEHFMVAQ